MNKTQAMPYVAVALDDALAVRDVSAIPDNARLVGWQCGFEPMFVAVFSYLGVKLDDAEAENIATDYLREKAWFSGEPTAADYIL